MTTGHFILPSLLLAVIASTLVGEEKKVPEKRQAIMVIDIIRVREKAKDLGISRAQIVEAMSRLIEADKDQKFSYREIGEWKIDVDANSAHFKELVEYDLKIEFDSK